MKYQDTLDYLFSRLPMYQREGVAAYKTDINNIIKAVQHLRNPHKKFKSIHIAGTNGKGSTAHMITSILQDANYKIGLYTSPHLKDFRERIKINGEMISKKEVINFVYKHKDIFEDMKLSFFEFTVAMAFNHFANSAVDLAVIETGLGGRLDSTNIIKPEISIITNISLDHTNLLGDTLQQIALEKGGIIKSNTPVIIGKKQKETSKIFETIANKKNARLTYAKTHNYNSDLKGNYQSNNINLAVSTILELKNQGWLINTKNIKVGLLNTIKNTGILGRWQTIAKNPLVICDTGHNKDGIMHVINQLKQIPHRKLHFVFGIVNDKNTDHVLALLPKTAIYYFCQVNIQRAMAAKKLKKKANNIGLKGNYFNSVNEAFKSAKSKAIKEDLIFIGGSTFVVAEIV